MSTDDALEEVLDSGRWMELRPYLGTDVDEGVRTEVRAWYRARRRDLLEKYRWALPGPGRQSDGPGMVRALALACATPTQAANDLHRLTFGWRPSAVDELAVDASLARGREFCQPFLDAVSRLTFSKDDEWSMGWVAAVGLPLIDAGVADLPDGSTFGRGWAAFFTSRNDGSLVEELRGSPAVGDALALAMTSPGALARFESHRPAGRELEDAVTRLTQEGVLLRERVVAGALEALTRPDTAHTQRALARILDALHLEATDGTERGPLLQHLLATTSGPVTAVLLPVALEVADDPDVVAIAATVFARSEKAQRTTLLKALVSPGARWSVETRTQALTFATEVRDQALAVRAVKALAELGADLALAQPVPVHDLWTNPPAVEEAGPTGVIAPDEAAMTAALSRMAVAMDASDGAMFWDAAVRWAWADPAGVRDWAGRVEDRVGDLARPSGFYGLRPTWRPVTAASHQGLCATVERAHTGVRADRDVSDWSIISRSTTQIVHDVLVSESTLRLGEIPYLLSTPTRRDGTLDLATVVQRLRGYGRRRVGPADLFVALTRLEATGPERARDLDGISVRLWSPERDGLRGMLHRNAPADAAEIVRRWVGGGGLPALQVTHRGGGLDIAPSVLPVTPSVLSGLPPSLTAGHEDGRHEEYADYMLGVEADAGMLPGWADLLATKLQRSFDQKLRTPPLMLDSMARSPSPGPAVIHVVAQTLSHADEDRRLLAVDAALTLMGRGLWDIDGYTTCCAHLLDEGALRLGRLVHSWEQLILAGGLQPLWPTACPVLDRACGLERKPPGLADLLDMLGCYVRAVPAIDIPESVRTLADSRSSSRARAAAAGFVGAAG